MSLQNFRSLPAAPIHTSPHIFELDEALDYLAMVSVTSTQTERRPMRFLLKVRIPVEAGNAAAKSGKLGATIQSILADLKPEAAYFTDDNGQRTGLIVVDMANASQIPAIAEPWFLAFNASIEFKPVMIPDDLAKAGSSIEAAVKKYG